MFNDMFNLGTGTLSPLKTGLSVITTYWWIYAPVLLLLGTIVGWVHYVTQKYLLSLNWVLLEIKPPPDVEKSPRIAESIFAGIHGTYLPVKWKRRFFKGEVPTYFSFEIVGNGGETNFYVRTPETLRPLIESHVFAQYPDAEIRVAEDYVKNLPNFLPNDQYDLFGVDLIFSKDDQFPIKTYPFFEEEGGRGEAKRTTPLSPLAEVMSSLEPGEHIWLQMLVRPTGGAWVKAAKPVIDKIIGLEEKKEDLLAKSINLTYDFIAGGEAEKKEEKKEEPDIRKLTPGKRSALEQVERKIAKLGFKTTIRFIYIGRREIFHRAHISSVIGMFKQLYANDLNSFKPNTKTMTFHKGILNQIFPSDRGFFTAQIEFRRKWKLYLAYRSRTFPKKVVILNTEELATLYHLPGAGLKAPAFPRVEAKKGQPPAGLPT